VVSKVVFYRTTADGQEQLASLGADRSVSGDRAVIDTFLDGQDLGEVGDAELLGLMKDAPRRFDGAYLRAEFVGGS
jgi:hypothetical protein